MAAKSEDMEALRESASKALIALLWLHVLVVAGIAIARGTAVFFPMFLTMLLAGAATLSRIIRGNDACTRMIVAVSLMGGVGVIAYQMAGHPWQIDVHMYFFAALACLVMYCDYRSLLLGTVSVALNHLALNFVLPAAIFPGGADLGRVVLHAAILLIEAGVLIWLAHKLVSLFETAAQQVVKIKAANAAESLANSQRVDAELQAKRERDASRRRLASDFEHKVGHIVEAVAVAASSVQKISSSISTSSQDTALQLAVAASASRQASESVATVASATEELTASIGEINHQATRSAHIADKAAAEARRTNTVVEGLVSSTQKIGEVVSLIQTIANQTNLLALNATIESARAGEHGKGFAVVASEVKTLAAQTAHATEEIAMQIGTIQNATSEAVTAIQAIAETISELNAISTAIASAVDQQSAATSQIGGNIQSASSGANEVTANFDSVAKTSKETGLSAAQLLEAANELSADSIRLKSEVKEFLGSIHAA